MSRDGRVCANETCGAADAACASCCRLCGKNVDAICNGCLATTTGGGDCARASAVAAVECGRRERTFYGGIQRSSYFQLANGLCATILAFGILPDAAWKFAFTVLAVFFAWGMGNAIKAETEEEFKRKAEASAAGRGGSERGDEEANGMPRTRITSTLPTQRE
jgi:hypothetical protein